KIVALVEVLLVIRGLHFHRAALVFRHRDVAHARREQRAIASPLSRHAYAARNRFVARFHDSFNGVHVFGPRFGLRNRHLLHFALLLHATSSANSANKQSTKSRCSRHRRKSHFQNLPRNSRKLSVFVAHPTTFQALTARCGSLWKT